MEKQLYRVDSQDDYASGSVNMSTLQTHDTLKAQKQMLRLMEKASFASGLLPLDKQLK